MQDAKFRWRKLTTIQYPIIGPQSSVSPNTQNIELKNFEQVGTIARLFIRFVGNIIVAGAGPAGTPTGRDNPEGLLILCQLKTTPDLGVNVVNNMSARGLLRQAMYERGYLIKAASVPDVAGTTPVDYSFEINFRNPLSVKPVEYSLPMALFSSAQLQLTFGGREELFSGGLPNTWDLSGLSIQIWADMDLGIAGTFHMTCLDERSFPAITASQSDFQLTNIPPGYVYTSMLLRGETNLALDNSILQDWTIQGGGRIWTPQGDLNATMIQRWNRETNLTDPAVVQTGLYFINALRDGMITNAIDSLDSQLDVKANVVATGGTSQFLTLVSKRSIPNALSLAGVVAAGATTTTGTAAAGSAASPAKQ